LLTITGRGILNDSTNNGISLEINSTPTTALNYTSIDILTQGDGVNAIDLIGINTVVEDGLDKQIAYRGRVDDASLYNRVFDGAIQTAPNGSENSILFGVNSVSASSDEEYGFDLTVNGTGNALDTLKYGGSVLVENLAAVNFGLMSTVSGAHISNYGLYSQIYGSDGSQENAAVYGQNSIGVPSGRDLEYGGQFIVDGIGVPIDTVKFGVSSVVSNFSATAYGVYSVVSDADINNIGGYFRVQGPSGPTNYGVYATNESSIGTVGLERQYGGYFGVSGAGSATSTIKYGIESNVIGDSSISSGANIYVYGADSSNYGVYSLVAGPSGDKGSVAVLGTNSVSVPSSSPKGRSEYGGLFNVIGLGLTGTTVKYGVSSNVSFDAKDSYGFYGEVSGAENANYGVYSNVSGPSGGTNYGVYSLNNSSNLGTDSQWAGYFETSATGALGTNKYGIEILVEHDGGNHWGVKSEVQGGINNNYGLSSSITGSTGQGNYAVYAINTSTDSGGSDTQWGGYFEVNSSGTTGAGGTTKYGVQSYVSGTGTTNYGVHIEVDSAQYNYSLYANKGRHTFYHDPNSELGVNDPEGYGDIVYFGGGGSTFNAGDVVYLDNAGDWLQTDAAATGTAINMLAIALGAAPSDGLLIRGYAYNSNWTINSGEPVYLETGVPGGITNTAPSAAGEVVRIIGHGTDNANRNKIYFNPDGSWVEI